MWNLSGFFSQLVQSQPLLRRTALISLTVQNAGLVLLTRYARTRTQDMFLASTAVVMAELIKLLMCFLLVFIEEGCSLVGMKNSLLNNVLRDPWDCFLVSIPGILYTIQNNLLYVGYSHLTAMSFQISYQLKIFTTAIFFRLILHRRLSLVQWISLIVLFSGVLMTQLNDLVSDSKSTEGISSTLQHPLIGLLSVVAACISSGFAGVYFEKLLKGSHKSVAIRNIQLAFYGVGAGLVTVYVKDGNAVASNGFFFGYDGVVWAVVLIQSLGGLLVAATIRYADNILKGFATSLAIVLTLAISIIFFQFHASLTFFCGGTLVVVATMLYSAYPFVEPEKPTSMAHSTSA